MKTMNRDKAIIIILLVAAIAPFTYNWYFDNVLHDWEYNWCTGERICRKTGIIQVDAARVEAGVAAEYYTINQVDNPLEIIEQWRQEGNLVIH